MTKSGNVSSSANLVFISNELLSSALRQEMKLPLIFVSFAMIKGKMYNSIGTTIVLPEHTLKAWGNDTIYGAIYLLQDYQFYIRILDAYHSCSLAVLRKNHVLDLQHRMEVTATLIKFESFDELAVLKFTELGTTKVDAYFGNMENRRVSRVVYDKDRHCRVESGIVPSIRDELNAFAIN